MNTAMDEFSLGSRICHSLGAAIISLPESNTRWNQPYQILKLNNTIRKIWATSSIQTSQHPEPFYNQHQRGGTLQIVTDHWVSRIQAKGVDPYGLGRWSYSILTGKRDKKIVIITAYRVCNTTASSSGDCTLYMQQYRTILAYSNSHNITTTPTPQRQFVLDLQAWIEMLQASGCSIILSLDANEDVLSTKPNYHQLEYKEGTFIKAPTMMDTWLPYLPRAV
jgi:hypothetical protein